MTKEPNNFLPDMATVYMEGQFVIPEGLIVNLDKYAEIIIKINGKEHKIDREKLEKLLEELE